jgi:hypothetical protein
MLRLSPNLVRTTSLLSILAMSAALAFGQPVAATQATLTVGDFLLQYARSVHVALPADATPEAAMAALQAAKALPGDTPSLVKALTHGDVVKLGRAAGLKITSRTPEKSFSQPEADMFFETFGGLLESHAGTRASSPNGNGDDLRTAAGSAAPGHANTSKGKKKGRPFQSPSNPD